jgi:hypothetical protein
VQGSLVYGAGQGSCRWAISLAIDRDGHPTDPIGLALVNVSRDSDLVGCWPIQGKPLPAILHRYLLIPTTTSQSSVHQLQPLSINHTPRNSQYGAYGRANITAPGKNSRSYSVSRVGIINKHMAARPQIDMARGMILDAKNR